MSYWWGKAQQTGKQKSENKRKIASIKHSVKEEVVKRGTAGEVNCIERLKQTINKYQEL